MRKAPFYDVEDPDNRRSCGCRPDQECAECGQASESWLFDAIRCDVCGESAQTTPSLNDPKRMLYICPNGCEQWELEGCIKVKVTELQTPGIITATWEDFRPKESM